jgi:hypothetical protein
MGLPNCELGIPLVLFPVLKPFMQYFVLGSALFGYPEDLVPWLPSILSCRDLMSGCQPP